MANTLIFLQGWDETLQDDNLEFETSLWSSPICPNVLSVAENQIEHFLQLSARLLSKMADTGITGNPALFAMCKMLQESLMHFISLFVPLAKVHSHDLFTFLLYFHRVIWESQSMTHEHCLANGLTLLVCFKLNQCAIKECDVVKEIKHSVSAIYYSRVLCLS